MRMRISGLMLAATLMLSVPAGEAGAQSGPIPSAPVGQGFDTGNNDVRLDQLEQQIRVLTGQVEQLNFQVQQLQEQLRRQAEDTEFRFQELSQGKAPSARPSQSNLAPQQPAQNQQQGQDLNLPTGPVAAAPLSNNGFGAPPTNLGTLPANEPLNIIPPAISAEPQTGGTGSSGSVALAVPSDPQTAYDVAYAFILQQDYPAAQDAFASFLDSYPSDALSGNARYWLGESYFAQGQYREAADAFLNGYQLHKNGSKAPDSLLRLGMSLAQLGQKDAACASFAELKKSFPKASGQVKQQAAREAKNAGC